MAPMRETQRRKLIRRAQAEGEKKAASAIAASLQQRYKALQRELRRQNLRKRLAKSLRDTGDLTKAVDPSWTEWMDAFTAAIKDALTFIIGGVWDAETRYWDSREQRVDPVNAEKIIDAYEKRVGKQIKNIAEDTKQSVLEAISDWYNTDASLPELIDDLGQFFDEDRSELIARTESTYITSQVALEMMDKFDVNYFNVDLAEEEGPWPCDECRAKADANPHKKGDPMPPYHPDDRCGVVYATEDGDEFIYGADED